MGNFWLIQFVQKSGVKQNIAAFLEEEMGNGKWEMGNFNTLRT